LVVSESVRATILRADVVSVTQLLSERRGQERRGEERRGEESHLAWSGVGNCHAIGW
jgi:hypothetical protein